MPSRTAQQGMWRLYNRTTAAAAAAAATAAAATAMSVRKPRSFHELMTRTPHSLVPLTRTTTTTIERWQHPLLVFACQKSVNDSCLSAIRPTNHHDHGSYLMQRPSWESRMGAEAAAAAASPRMLPSSSWMLLDRKRACSFSTTSSSSNNNDATSSDISDSKFDEERTIEVKIDFDSESEDVRVESKTDGLDRSRFTEEVKVRMPDMGEGENKIIKWYKKEGDVVHRDDVICDIETPDFVFGMETEDEQVAIMGKILIDAPSGPIPDNEVICILLHEKKQPKGTPAAAPIEGSEVKQ